MRTEGINEVNDEMNEEFWEVDIDGRERNRLEEHMGHIDELGRQKIFTTAAKILSKCPNPNAIEGASSGLALGKVQSGKTSSFVALTALAFDNNYRIVIVLAGTKKNLLSQTDQRIRKQLNIDMRSDRKIASLSTKDNLEDLQQDEIAAIIESGNNVLITALKHHDHIEKIRQVFSSSDLNNLPTLIIDDEGDQASLNTKVKKGKRSKTYDVITQMKSTFNHHAFVAYTATPQANLLINTLDDLFPDFCTLVEPGDNYTGGSTFHGKNQDKYMRIIPENDIDFEKKIPDKFIEALGIYFVGGALRSLRKDKGLHSMLIHTSVSKADHEHVTTRIKSLVQKWKTIMNMPKNDPSREGIEQIFFTAYEDLTKHTSKASPSWRDVQDQLKNELREHKIFKVNSSKDADSTNTKLNLKNNIFIGGNMLERGVTIDGLAITYITRRAKTSQSDTVEQRARWFGYKGSYLDVCRIFAPLDIKNGFSDLLGDEDYLWNRLKENEIQGVPVRSWSRIIRCSPQFRPTRPSVATVVKVKVSDWIIQSRPSINEEIASNNMDLVKGIFSSEESFIENFGGTQHRLLRNYGLKSLYEETISLVKNDRKDDDAILSIKTVIRNLIKSNPSQTIDLVLMHNGEKRSRNYKKNRIDQLMQGKNKKYKGDKKFLDSSLSLQFHIVQPIPDQGDLKVKETVALALYVDDELVEELGNLVRPSGK